MLRIKEIDEMISLFTELTGVGICFYDLGNFFNYNKLGKRKNIGHYCDFCNAVRVAVGGKPACEQSDRIRAVSLAGQYDQPFFFKCHMGLQELVVPIKYEGRLNGVIFVGQCRVKGIDASDDIAEASKRFDLSGQKMVEIYNQMPELGKDSMMYMGRMLQLYFSSLTTIKEAFPNSEAELYESLPLAERIKDIINKNYMYDINLQYLSRLLFLSREHILREFTKTFKMGVSEYLTEVRITNAKRLLLNSDIPVSSIAVNVGFNDANYFARVFKQETGVTPSKFRKIQRYPHKSLDETQDMV